LSGSPKGLAPDAASSGDDAPHTNIKKQYRSQKNDDNRPPDKLYNRGINSGLFGRDLIRYPGIPSFLSGTIISSQHIVLTSNVTRRRLTGSKESRLPGIQGIRGYISMTGNAETVKKATFGAGCFWGVEAAFSDIKGVISTAVGYMGGTFKNPGYKDVCTGQTGHAEVVQVAYDPQKVSYEHLLKVFWSIHDPTQLNRQGPDIGTNYRSVIFYHDAEQGKLARKSKETMEVSGAFGFGKIMTEILPAPEFYRAEEYHQQYHKKQGGSSRI
jgi:peptide-methionine (S)-S-oxide reductase